MASRNYMLPSLAQCMSLTDEQCRMIQDVRDPEGTRANRDWELPHQSELIRLYMAMMSFVQIEMAMREKLGYSYKTYSNRFRDWLFPILRIDRERVIIDLFAHVSNAMDPRPGHTSLDLESPRFLSVPSSQQRHISSSQAAVASPSLYHTLPLAEAARSSLQTRQSFSTLSTRTSTSAYSAYGDDGRTFSTSGSSIATRDSSLSGGSRYSIPLHSSYLSHPPLSGSPIHDPTSGLWNGILRVIPCGMNHASLTWYDDFTGCQICGFTQWHALMLRAQSLSMDEFVEAIRRIRDVEQVDFAGNYPMHFLVSAGVTIHQLNYALDWFGCASQNFYGQNPVHVLNARRLGDSLIGILEAFKALGSPPGVLLSQRDIYCHTPLHTILQQPLDHHLYRKIFKIFPSVSIALRALDTSGRDVISLMREAALHLQVKSVNDESKILSGIGEIALLLSGTVVPAGCTEEYGFQDIARGARGNTIFGVQFQCRICKETNTHSSSCLDQIICARKQGMDCNAPDVHGMTPAHLLVSHSRCNKDGLPETSTQTFELFCALLPRESPRVNEALHILDPQGNSLTFNIATRGHHEILEYVLSLESRQKQRMMVNTTGKTTRSIQLGVLSAVEAEIEANAELVKRDRRRSKNTPQLIYARLLDDLQKVKDILLVAGATTPNSFMPASPRTPIAAIHDRPMPLSSRPLSLQKDAVSSTRPFNTMRKWTADVSGYSSPGSGNAVTAKSSSTDLESFAINSQTQKYHAAPASPGASDQSGRPVELRTPLAADRETPMKFFPINAETDANMISSWRAQALPAVKILLCLEGDESIAITMLRQGSTSTESSPVVRIQTSKPRSESKQNEVRKKVAILLAPLAAPRIIFSTGSVKRTATRSDFDIKPCSAQNTAFSTRPPMGASIGVGGSNKDTATLGGYIFIDEVPHVLTVHHLFHDETSGLTYEPGTAITQPSLQEVDDFATWWDYIRRTEEAFHLECVQAMFAEIKACLNSFAFGNLVSSSGFRNRSARDGLTNIEMDWAVCRVDESRVGSNITPCDKHWCRDVAEVAPNRNVFSVGRTSGWQSGVVNGDTTYMKFCGDDGVYRESEEWSIVRSDTTPEHEWITSGIGTFGDSGAWILETGTDNVMGQLWGRDFKSFGEQSEGSIITYFTPIQDIFDDIREVTGAAQVTLYAHRDHTCVVDVPGMAIVHSGVAEFSRRQSLSWHRCRLCNMDVLPGQAEETIAALDLEIASLRSAGQDILFDGSGSAGVIGGIAEDAGRSGALAVELLDSVAEDTGAFDSRRFHSEDDVFSEAVRDSFHSERAASPTSEMDLDLYAA